MVHTGEKKGWTFQSNRHFYDSLVFAHLTNTGQNMNDNKDDTYMVELHYSHNVPFIVKGKHLPECDLLTKYIYDRTCACIKNKITVELLSF